MPTFEVVWEAKIKGRILVEAETSQEADRLVEDMDISTLADESYVDDEVFVIESFTAQIGT